MDGARQIKNGFFTWLCAMIVMLSLGETRAGDFVAASHPESGQIAAVNQGSISDFYDASQYDASGYTVAPNSTALQKVGICFVAGTLVSTADGQKVIESLKLGDRVLTTDTKSQSESTEVDPKTWRKITLKMPNPACPRDILDIEVLRSPEWIARFGCEEGRIIHFILEEMGLEGPAEVVAIGDCPEIRQGVGRVVLVTVTHFNENVHELRLANGQTLEPTGRHRLFSVTRNDWIKTSDLEVGEVLKTRGGEIEIESIKRRDGEHRVYNIEVETEHCYYVSKTEVLSHNTNPCAAVVSKRMHFKKAQLPMEGKVRFIPPKNWKPTQPLPRGPQKGYLDKFGNEWTKEPSRTKGQAFEWDVQRPDGSH